MASAQSCSWVLRGTVKVECLEQEHSTMMYALRLVIPSRNHAGLAQSSTQALVCTTHLKHRENCCTSHFRSLKKIHLNGFDSHPFRNSLIFTVLVLLSGYDWKRCLRMEVHPERNDSLSITHLPRENMDDGTW